MLDEILYQMARSLLATISRFGASAIGDAPKALAACVYVCFAHSSLVGERRFGTALRAALESFRAVLCALRERARTRVFMASMSHDDFRSEPFSLAFFAMIELTACVEPVECNSVLTRAPQLELLATVAAQSLWTNEAAARAGTLHDTCNSQPDVETDGEAESSRNCFLKIFDKIVKGLDDTWNL